MSAGTPVAEPIPTGMWDQIVKMFRWGRIALNVVAVLFVVMLIGQGVAIIKWAAEIHWLVGWLAGGLLAVGLGFLIGVPAYHYLKTPKVVEPPAVPDTGAASAAHLAAITRYLDRVLVHGQSNHALQSEWQNFPRARQELAEFTRRAKSASGLQVAQLDKELSAWADKTLGQLWKPVEQRADRLIYQESLTVGLATALSPNGTLDAFVMLWRSSRLVSQLAVLYYGRPGVWGTLAICRDVAVASAVAGYLQSVTDSLGQLVLSTVGGVGGMVAGPAVDGITNALVLTRMGYLAQARCRSYRRWTRERQRSALLAAVAATHKVAFGLSAEILRQAGYGLGAVAGAAASGMAKAAGALGDVAESAAAKVGAAAGVAVQTATGWGQAIKQKIMGKPEPSQTG